MCSGTEVPVRRLKKIKVDKVPRLTLPDDDEQVVPASSNHMQKNIPKPRSKGQHVSHDNGDTVRQDWGDVPDKEMDDEAGYAEEEDYDEAGEVDDGLDHMAPEELEEAMTNERPVWAESQQPGRNRTRSSSVIDPHALPSRMPSPSSVPMIDYYCVHCHSSVHMHLE
ncbi:hypothetical protein C8Q72DRAFT_825277 [Fomitopsis betulina]|nr:hypothetical protein C8Q72DRAFT_825277 [Fomitopsis betulina]